MFGGPPWQQAPYSPYGTSQSPYYSGAPQYGYGSPYTAYGGGLRSNPYAAGGAAGLNGAPLGPPSGPGDGLIDRVHSGFSTVGSVTEAMARVTGMLDSNWHSLFMSFASMVRLVEGVHVMRGEFWALLKALSVAKLLHSLYEWFVPPRRPLLADPSSNAAEFMARVGSRRRSYFRLFAVLTGLALLVGPWLYSRLAQRRAAAKHLRARRRSRTSTSSTTSSRSSSGVRDEGEVEVVLTPGEADSTPVSRFAECLTDYEAMSGRELSMRRGDVVYVAARVGQHWLAVERRDGARGLVPTTVMRPYDEELRSSARRSVARRRRSNVRVSEQRFRPVDNDVDDDDEDDDEDDDDDDDDAEPRDGKLPATPKATPTASDRHVARGASAASSGRRRRFSDEEVAWWERRQRR